MASWNDNPTEMKGGIYHAAIASRNRRARRDFLAAMRARFARTADVMGGPIMLAAFIGLFLIAPAFPIAIAAGIAFLGFAAISAARKA